MCLASNLDSLVHIFIDNVCEKDLFLCVGIIALIFLTKWKRN